MATAVIIGTGAAGTHAALTLRREEWAGPIHLIGDEPYNPYDRTLLSKPGSSPCAVLRLIVDEATLKADRITCRFGRSAVMIDRSNKTVSLDDGSSVVYDKLLLALGSGPRKLTCLGRERAHSISSISDSQWLASAIVPGCDAVIVGAGLLGLELAATLRAWEINVTIVEQEQRALGEFVPSELADRLVSRHCSEGVNIRFGRCVKSIGPEFVELDDETKIKANLVVSAIGNEPRTRLARECGLPIDDGIVVNGRFQTDDPSVFSAGDCAVVHELKLPKVGRSKHWKMAKAQGEAAARSMMGKSSEVETLNSFNSKQYDLEIQAIGSFQRQGEIIARTSFDHTVLFVFDLNGVLAGVCGLGEPAKIDATFYSAPLLVGRRFGQSRYRLADERADLRKLLRTTRKSPKAATA